MKLLVPVNDSVFHHYTNTPERRDVGARIPVAGDDVGGVPDRITLMPDSLTKPVVSQRLSDAFAYALELHKAQVRKQAEGDSPNDGVPYISHLMMVAGLVLEHGGDEDEAIAALLHDGPEDQGGEEILAEISARFGERVAEIVEACSDTFEDPKPEWWARKHTYHETLRRASHSALLVSLADKTHNLEATRLDVKEHGNSFWGRFTQGRQGSLWYYATLLEIYRERVRGKGTRLVKRLEAALDGLWTVEEKKAALEYGPEDGGEA